jgi:hypothetical protein
VADNFFDQFDGQAPKSEGASRNFFDQFDQPDTTFDSIKFSDAKMPTNQPSLVTSGQSFATPAGTAPQAPERPREASVWQHMLEGFENTQRGVGQRTNPNVYHGDGTYLRPVLGEISSYSDTSPTGLEFKTPTGDVVPVDQASHVVLRDPVDGKLKAFQRNPDWDESGLTSLSRFVTQGIATGPPTGVARQVAGQAASRTSSLMAAERAAEMGQDAQAFRDLGVRPFGPAFSQGPVASVAKQLSETPIIGAPVRNALEESIVDTRNVLQGIAERYGTSATADEAGRVAQAGLERYKDARPTEIVERAATGYTPEQISEIIATPARETSLKTKQAALYERAWNYIPEPMRQGRAVAGQPRVVGDMPNARAVLEEIQARNARMLVGGAEGANAGRAAPIASGGMLGGMVDAIMNPRWRASLQTMRDIRSDFRRLASGMADTEKNTLRLSDVERVQSAVTRDMIGLLERNQAAYAAAGDARTARDMGRAITSFRRADQFTRLSMERMETIEKLFNANNATELYRNIANSALGGTKGDVNKLRVLNRTLQRPEMDEIAAYTLRQMGQPVPSARGIVQEAGFSPSSFMTRLNAMEPEARNLIFGHGHTEALNNLGRVVNRIANVEALANTSRSGTNALNLGAMLTGGGMLATGAWQQALGVAATGLAASVLFSRPAYVRWATGYANMRARALQVPSQNRAALTAHVAKLAEMAKHDPALLPVYRAIASENGVLKGSDQEQPVKQ